MNRTRQWIALTGTMALALSCASVRAEEAPATAPAPPAEPGYIMPSTQMWDMTSDDGEIYRIFVSYPETEMPADGYPVLYVLDGNAMFAAFAEARRIQEYYDAGKAIIVGVGYPTNQAYDVRRLNDYTPPLLDPPPANVRQLAKYKSGGQDTFLDFLTGKLRTEIGRRFKIDPERQSLFGHSLGGLVALHTLFTRPQAFNSIVAASPSLEWNEQGELAEEHAFVERLKSGKVGKTSRLMIVVGDRDRDDDPVVAEAFAERMKLLSGYGLRSRIHHYPDEVHLSVPVRAVPDTLRFLFEAP